MWYQSETLGDVLYQRRSRIDVEQAIGSES
jgi:hypothetical protein